MQSKFRAEARRNYLTCKTGKNIEDPTERKMITKEKNWNKPKQTEVSKLRQGKQQKIERLNKKHDRDMKSRNG